MACATASPNLTLVSLGGDGDDESGALQVDDLVGSETPVACNPNRDQNIPALIAYTSGTTGIPKGAVFTQDAPTFTAVNSNNVWNMQRRDHVLTYLPMFHVGGLLIHTLPAFHVGASVTIQQDFEAGSVLDSIGHHGVSLILASPWEHHRRKSHSAGTSVLYTQARVFSEDMQRLPPGEGVRCLFDGRLAEYQHPKHIVFMDEFPRTSLGKVRKPELARRARDLLPR